MSTSDKTIYVVGHKNPDTDSICSAIGYAAFKTRSVMPPTFRDAQEISTRRHSLSSTVSIRKSLSF